MIIALEIENTEKCPFRSGSTRFMQTPKCHKEMTPLFQYPACVGLESHLCPCNRIRCETCGQIGCSRTTFFGSDGDKDCKHCSNWLPIKVSK